MSRLIDPGVGDVTDRLTILALKVLFGREGQKDVSHFEREQTALLAKVRARDHSGPWFHLTLELAAVNAALWHSEDELREYRMRKMVDAKELSWTEEVARCGMRIQELNDRRAELIAQINKEAGDGAAKEKLHGES